MNNSGNVRTLVFSAPVATALTTSSKITVTFGTSTTDKAVSVCYVSGLASASYQDKSATATGSSASPSSGATGTTTQASELLIGAIGGSLGFQSFTAGSGFTALTVATVGTNNIQIDPEYEIVSATNTYSATGTYSYGTPAWAAAIVTYKASVITTTTTVTSSGTPSTYGNSVTFTATVTSTSGVPTGTVEFYNGSTAIGAGTALSGSGNSATSTFATTTLSAGTYTSINAVYTATGSFTGSTSPNFSQTVNPLPVTLSGSRTYDGTTTAASTILSITNVVGSDNVTVASGSATLAAKNAGGEAISSVGTLALGGTAAANYTLTGASGTVTVNAKALTYSGVSAPSSKVYDGTTTAVASGTPALQAAESAGSGTSSDGKPYSGDTVSATGTATGTYNTKDVATATTVTFAGITLTGAQASNYSLTALTQAATITVKTLTVSGPAASNKIYDGTTADTLTGTAALLTTETGGSGSTGDGKPYTGDTVTLGGTAAGTFAAKNVATGISVTVTGNTLSGAQAGDYVLAANEESGLTANITAKTLTVSGLAASNKIYDGTTADTLTGTAALLTTETGGSGSTGDGKPYTGDTVTLGGTAAGTFAAKNVATGSSVTVTGNTLSGAQAGNYVLAANEESGLTANITAKTLTVTGLATSNKTYDGTTADTLTGTPVLLTAETGGSGSTGDGTPYTGDTVTLGGTAAGTFSSKNVASGISVTVTGNTLSGAQAGDYVLAANEESGLTANITAKTLTVSGLAASNKTYDGTTADTLTGTAALLTAETGGSGTTSDGKPYSGDTVTLGGTATGTLTAKDVATGISLTVSGNTLSGAQAGDYVLATNEESGLSANITAKTLSVTGLAANSKTYDATTAATLTGTAAFLTAETGGSGSTSDGKPYTNDTVSLRGVATGSFAAIDVGTGITVSVSGLALERGPGERLCAGGQSTERVDGQHHAQDADGDRAGGEQQDL